MTQDKIDMFIAQKGDMLPDDKKSYIIDRLKNLSDDKSTLLLSIGLKNPTTTLILSLLTGIGDRIYLGQIGLAMLKLFTAGGFFIWYLLDLINYKKNTENYNMKLLDKHLY